MIDFRIALMIAGIVMPLLSAPAHAYDYRVLRYGDTSPWSYDGRDDKRDFPTNGFFPGNFVTDPSSAWIGAGGFLSSNPRRSVRPYPSQVVFDHCTAHHHGRRRMTLASDSSFTRSGCSERNWPGIRSRQSARK